MASTVHAPSLDAGLGWLNTDRPLSFDGELAGRVVVLDFWTYCCINCMHILPDLAELEEKYAAEPVVFLGVHSSKFTNEASGETIRAAIQRYEIKHPVVIDDNMKLWRAFAVRSWPTLVVVDARGYVVTAIAGEGSKDGIDQAIRQALEQGRAAGVLADGPLALSAEASVRASSGLAFPGKVLVDAELGLLVVADSNHNRIVVAQVPDEHGVAKVVRVVGNGAVGRDDGPADVASFHHPQGLAIGQSNVYVADTENNLIRAIDLESYEVTTIVGTGEMSSDRGGGGMGTQQGINWPWDLTIEGSTLYVAMAGTHQIWRIDLPVGFARAFAGSGRENLVDGPTETAALAQPSGICAMGGHLYFADSEVSAVRGVDMGLEKVFTVIGEGLFSFGDVDGTHPKAKLQHPLGIDAWNTSLLVADTYNHKIKVVDPGARSARTLYGTGSPGASTDDGGLALFEPGGLSVAGDELYIADTNNHRIVRVNLSTHEWTEVVFEGLALPANGDEPPANAIQVEPVAVAPDRDIVLVLDVTLPADSHLSPEAPWSVRVSAGDKAIAQRTGKSDAFPLRVTVPASAVTFDHLWIVEASFAYCTESGGSVCVPVSMSWAVPVSKSGDATKVTLFGDLTSSA